jgi:hypothetical protein
MLKNMVLCNLIAMKKCHVFLTAVENGYFYIKCAKRVFFVHEKVFYAETKVEAV